jgi:hypothetical protein
MLWRLVYIVTDVSKHHDRVGDGENKRRFDPSKFL